MSSAVRRQIARSGRDWTIQTWTVGAKDAYQGDTMTLDAAVTIKALRTETAKERIIADEKGQERTVDAQILIAQGMTGDPDLSDIRDTTKRAPVVISPEGQRFDAVALGLEGLIHGFSRVFLFKQRGGSV